MFKSIPFIKKMNSYTLSLRDGKNISFENFANSLIPFPPLSEQQKIADFLDEKVKEIDNAIEKTKETIELYEKYKQAIITEVVTKGLDPDVEMKDSGVEWIGEIPKNAVVAKIKNLFDVTLGKMLQNEKKSNTDTFENYLSAINIKWTGIDDSINKRMWFSDAEKEIYLLKKGDICVMEGGLAGTASIYKQEMSPCYFQNSINRCRAKGKANNKYLYYWLQYIYHTGYIESICNKATITHYTKEKLENTPIVIDFNTQDKIVEHLDDKCKLIEELIEKEYELINTLVLHKKSLIYEYVTGKKEVK